MPQQHTERPDEVSVVHHTSLFQCPFESCTGRTRLFRSRRGWTRHRRTYHPGQNEEARIIIRSPSPQSQVHEYINRDDIFLQNVESIDQSPSPERTESIDTSTECHPTVNGNRRYNEDSNPSSDPPSPLPIDINDWAPFQDEIAFHACEYFFKDTQTSARNIDRILKLWAASLARYNGVPPFTGHRELYKTIDSISTGVVPWQPHTFSYEGPKPDISKWTTADFTIWYRNPYKMFLNMLKNPEFANYFDYAPLRKFNSAGARQYDNFMTGDWDILAQNPENDGAVFVPIILGSDKTTVSVATGHNEYWPLYGSIGNIHNNIRRAHGSGLVLIAFLCIPQVDHSHSNDPTYRNFRRQLFHSSLSKIFETCRPVMEHPEIAQFPDGSLRKTIWGFGSYIADYPEQVLLGCIVTDWCITCPAPPGDLDGEASAQQRSMEIREMLIETCDVRTLWSQYGIVANVIPFTNDFPRADIHEIMAPDLLHQLIKGVFKDHLVNWVEDYLIIEHGRIRANQILDDIDHRIAIVPPFAGLRHFPDGRCFRQWTGDDSKALMKVYMPALEGHLPVEIIRTFRAFLDFCYIARKDALTEDDLDDLQEALRGFHLHRKIFEESGVRTNFSLPRQHSLVHYASKIRLFGAPNGLCSSITESKHIRAVKETWRRSNRNEPLGQMLVTNQRLDQLAAARTNFNERNMFTELDEVYIPSVVASSTAQVGSSIHEPESADPSLQVSIPDEDPLDEAETDPNGCPGVKLPAKAVYRWHVSKAATKLELPHFQKMIRKFLYDHLYPNSEVPSHMLDDAAYPQFNGRLSIFYSATATFQSWSDISGIYGLHREYIRATPSWRNGQPRYDCTYIFSTLGEGHFDIARIMVFFSFYYEEELLECALVHHFSYTKDEPDENTGMWTVEPKFNEDGDPHITIIQISNIYRGAHLEPVYKTSQFVDNSLTMHDSLDFFKLFYVNKYIDYHAFGVATRGARQP